MHLVEDDPAVRATLTRLLESGGYTVRQYVSGRDFLDAASRLENGCILLDINMPEPDGFAVKRELSNRSVDLPVIMMSGAGDLTVLALKAGVSDFVQKPFGRSELLATMRQLDA